MSKDFIVAIELGSSKMTGIAGQKNLDGSITVLAMVEEDSSSCIRKGVIYNIDKTCQCLKSIISKLKNILKQDITQVYVGVGGRSIRSTKNVIVKDLQNNTLVNQSMVNELMDINRNMTYPDQEILDMAPQEYKIDSQYQIDPIGIQCNHIEGIFLNILWRKTFYNNINTCFENTHIAIADMYLAPLAMADVVLSDSEKRGGCMLVDMGADTTTVLVYYKGILRHISVIPLGGNNITKDLTCLQIEEQDAEKMKLKYAKAYTENSAIDSTLYYTIDKDRKVDSSKFIEIVEARVEEIVKNAWYQVPKEYKEKLHGGIILTGGGSNMPEIDKVFKNFIPVNKVRIAKFVNLSVTSRDPQITSHDGTQNTILGLLAKGDMSCAGAIINDNLSTEGEKPEEGDNRPPKKTGDTTGMGVVITAEEKRRREEEEKKKHEQEEEEKRKAAEEEAKRQAAEKREKSLVHKGIRFFKNFLKDAITEEE